MPFCLGTLEYSPTGAPPVTRPTGAAYRVVEGSVDDDVVEGGVDGDDGATGPPEMRPGSAL